MGATKVLSPADVAQFVERGWVKVPHAFARHDALEAQDFLWEQVEKRGILRADRTTWTTPLLQINENYDTPAFRACNTDRLADAIEDLVGEGRWVGRGKPNGWGWWPVNFAKGADATWDVPSTGWHWDGIHFRHRVDSNEQGLLCLCIFSDVGPRGGGTVIAEGSHKVVARYLATQPDGVEIGEGIRAVNQTHPWFRDLTGQEGATPISEPGLSRIERFMERETVDADGISLRVVETTAEAGDVILCHPFLYHAASQNHSGVPRFMCNRTTPLYERLNVHGTASANVTPLEESVRVAVGV